MSRTYAMEHVIILLVTLLACEASANCQDDNSLVSDGFCFGDRFSTQRNLPAEWQLLMDSYALSNLNGWTNLDQDGTGGMFTFSNSLCQTQIRFCSNSFPNPAAQNNWLVTHYIRYPSVQDVSGAQELFLQVTFRFGQCVAPTCTNRFIDVYRYDVDGPVDAAAIANTGNYNFLRGSQSESRLEDPSNNDVQITWSLPRPTRANGDFYNGLYIGLRDQGNCGNIDRIILYYMRSPGYTGTLLTCPSVPLALSGGTTTGTCCCGDNAGGRSSLTRMCSNPGGCVEPATDACGCLPGYEYNQPNCQACAAGTFQPDTSTESSCVSCPANSVALFPTAGVCNCTGATSRKPSQPRDPCAEPPSSPLLTSAPVVDGTLVTVCWGAAQDSGGLDDLHYNVYTRAGEPEYRKVNDGPITGTGELCYNVPGLNPGTSYTVVVTSANGATEDPEELNLQLSPVQGRFVAYFVGTGQAGLSREAAIAVTFFIAFLSAAGITGLIVALVMWFMCVKRNSTMGTSPKATAASYVSNQEEVKYENIPTSKKCPPPRPPTKPRV